MTDQHRPPMDTPIVPDNTSDRLDRIEAMLEQLMLQSRRPRGDAARVREAPAFGARDVEQGGGSAEEGFMPFRSAG